MDGIGRRGMDSPIEARAPQTNTTTAKKGGGKSNLREEWDGTGGEGTPEGAEEEEEERIPGLDRKEGSSSKKRMNDLWSFWTKDRSFENTVEVQICERSDP